MSKIYSRPRIRIPQIKILRIFIPNIENIFKSNYKNKRTKIIKILIILVIAFSTLKIVLDAILPIFNTLCIDKAKSISTLISNEQATLVMKNHKYDELFTIEKNSKGDISIIKSNVIQVNEIVSDIALNIQKEIDDEGRNKIEIPMGSFTGISLLAGRGPGIPIKISSIGNIETDLKSEFTSKGINQTLHRVFLQVDCEVSILTPYNNITKKISNQILIAENVIVGNIPETYYNIETTDQSDALEVMQ